jgi:DNA end-binding protein Ku
MLMALSIKLTRMRPLWTGALSFGLVNIPVRLYSATAGTGIGFRLLHKTDLEPIEYTRVCSLDGREVSYKDTVKGYKYRKHDYVILSDEDFKRSLPQRTKSIRIMDFVRQDEIDPVYYERPYFLEPAAHFHKPYALLRGALVRSGKVGVAKFVLRNKEHLAVVRPLGKMISLEQLRFREEIRDASELDLPRPGETPAKGREMEVAIELIDRLSEPFDPEAYQNTYQDELRRIIALKAGGKALPRRGSEPEPTNFADIVQLLKRSLEKERAKQ